MPQPPEPVTPFTLNPTALVEGNPVATFVLNTDHVVTHWNHACELLTGHSAASMVGTQRQWAAFYPSPRPVLADLILVGQAEGHALYRGGRRSDIVPGGVQVEDFFPNMGTEGRWLSFTSAPLFNEAGELCGAIETLQDVTDQRRAELSLQESRNLLAQIVDAGSVPTFVIGKDHRVTHWNRACEVLTGTPAQVVLGTTEQWRAFYEAPRPVMADIVLDGAQHGTVDAYYHGKFRPSPLIPGAFEAEDFFPAFGEHGRWVFFTASPIRNGRGEVVGAIETLQDVSVRKNAEIALKESEERYKILSQQDGLTQLFNARHLQDDLGREMERFQRYGRPLSVLMMDADHFKRINDTYGHLRGDQVLQELARTLLQALRHTDTGFRYGGEEFVALLPETSLDAAMQLAERIRTRFAALPMDLGGVEPVHCTLSIGVAQARDGDTTNSLMQRADEAVYRAKGAGRNRVEGS